MYLDLDWEIWTAEGIGSGIDRDGVPCLEITHRWRSDSHTWPYSLVGGVHAPGVARLYAAMHWTTDTCVRERESRYPRSRRTAALNNLSQPTEVPTSYAPAPIRTRTPIRALGLSLIDEKVYTVCHPMCIAVAWVDSFPLDCIWVRKGGAIEEYFGRKAESLAGLVRSIAGTAGGGQGLAGGVYGISSHRRRTMCGWFDFPEREPL